jgi:alcohol dehydrogenase class IV
MKSFSFQTCPNILFESGASTKIGELVRGLGVQRAMLVTSKGIRSAGLTRSTEDVLTSANIELSVFDDVVADPGSEVIERAAEQARDAKVELVLSIGDGSALDTAKLVAYIARTSERLDDIYGVGNAKGQRLPLILVPTTAGSGFGGNTHLDRDDPDDRKEGCGFPLSSPGLGNIGSQADAWSASGGHSSYRHRRNGACN